MKLRYLILVCLLFGMAESAYPQARLTEFIQNKGQWPEWIRYKATTPAGDVHLERDGMRYILCDMMNVPKMDSFHHGLMAKAPIMKFHVYKVTFDGANQQPEIEGSRPQKNYYNYFIGNDSSKWKSGIHPYAAIDYQELYKGITMHIASDHGSLEYEFFVKPGADASQIKMNFDGPDKMSIKGQDLVISTSVGQVMEMKPYAYQYINNEKTEVACTYHLKNNKVTFDLPNDYDHSQQLIIDPIVFWCSFTGSTADNWGFTATYDDTGNFYMAGLVNANPSSLGGFCGAYPVSPGAYQSTFGGGQGGSALEYAADLGVMKLSPDGVNRIYATYIGGSNNERPNSLIVDGSNNLCIAGRTHSADYPVTPGCYQPTIAGGWDIFVTKLNSSGTGLVASTFIGGTGDDNVNFDSTETGYGHLKYNYGDDGRSEIQVDKLGNIYVAGNSSSTNFPATPGALSTVYGGGYQDGVVFKFNPTLSTLLFSSYVGGIGDDAAYVLAFNKSQTSFYVAGGTNSTNFPTKPGCWQTTYQGDSADGFVLKFKNSPPYTLQKGTFVGTSSFDQVYGIQVDDTNNVYVMGQSVGGSFPVTAGSYSLAPTSTQFVMKMDSSLTSDLISTVFGSIPATPGFVNISPVAFLVDTCNNVYISGWGGNLMGGLAPVLAAHCGTTTNMPTSPGAYQTTTDGYDFYFIVFGAGLTSIRYATFYGRNAPGFPGEHVDGGTSRFDKRGVIYQAICANCGGTGGTTPPFPTTAGVWAPIDMCSGNCNEAGLKIAFNIGPVIANALGGPSTSGCAPLTVNFTNLSTNGLTYLWDFGDGSTTTTFSPTHTFTAAGVYTVRLSAANSNACFKVNDTFNILIVVDTATVYPGFTFALLDSCGPYIASFTNTSTDHIGTPTYQWLFGDGTTYSGITPPDHTYPDTGTYTVTLIMTDTGACKYPDTVIHIIRFYNLHISAHFTIPDSICLGTPFTPVNTFSNVTSTTWTFGDGTNSTAVDPSHLYGAVGTYTVTLIAANSGACNGGDTLTEIIKVLSVPAANFSYTPTVPVPNGPVTFTNLSTNATRYLWDFGDDSTSTEVNPVHMYDKTGNYKVCLNAYNTSNCPAKVCKLTPAEIQPLIGLPTAFSPNGDGENDILYVRGAAIRTLDLKIFNRWGQLVFETTSKEKGWDGTFNGQPQPIEAYAYVLNATFIDGTTKLMKGNITLLR